MEMILFVSIGTGLVFITLVFGCMSCRRKLTDEEIQQKYFRKFSKRHIIKNSYLSNRVDYIRSVAELKQTCKRKDGHCHIKKERSTSAEPNSPVVNVEGASPPPRSDYSFFDDSFQTVIEVSSSNGTSINNGESNQLVVSKDPFATYLSLHNSESQPCLTNETTCHHMSEMEGEVNEAFSDRQCTFYNTHSGSTCSLFDSYIVPNTGPKIQIIQPSVRRKVADANPGVAMETNGTSELQLSVSLLGRKTECEPKQEDKIIVVSADSCRKENRSCSVSDIVDGNKSQTGEGTEELREKRFQKLSVEGQIYHKKRPSSDDMYEKLHGSKTEQCIYKSLNKTSLILPGRPKMCSPRDTPARLRAATPTRPKTVTLARTRTVTLARSMSEHPTITRPKTKQTCSTGSGYSDHTYESITCELSGEINRRDSVASVESDYDTAYSNLNSENDKILKTPVHRGSYTDKQNDLSACSPEHTYESITSPLSARTNKTCENSAVIIGHRTSFDKNHFSLRIKNKFKQNRQEETLNNSLRMTSTGRDSVERYSPFPVMTKLAFKPAFKQVSSPRFSMIQTVTENANNQLGYQSKMFLDDLNIKTPEIKVDNCSQFFDDTAFISQDVLNANTINKDERGVDRVDFIKPLDKYMYQSVESDIQSKVSWSNLKISHGEKNMYYNKSLPSLSDHLEEEFELHCNSNIYTRSTPCDLDTQNCNFF